MQSPVRSRFLKPLPFVALALVTVISLVGASFARAAATDKSLSTNFTLVNLATAGSAVVTINYYTDTGAAWAVSAANQSVTLTNPGDQVIIRQYTDSTMPAGRGSAVASSSAPLGAVVQIQARNQVPTLGAYTGSSAPATKYYVPTVLRKIANISSSQIMIQNATSSAITADVAFTKASASGGSNFTKTGIAIAANSTYYYDIETETNLADGWFGSAVVTSASQIVVMSNLFTKPDTVQAFNAFTDAQLSSLWFVPLFVSRLSNGLLTPVSVQNLSGGTLAAGEIAITCTPDAASPTQGTITYSNSASVGVNETFSMNPNTDRTNLPTDWYGSCKVSTGAKNVAVFVQMRRPGVSQDAAAYEALNGNGTATKFLVPLVGKRLGSGFATVTTIQNLSASQSASVTLTYTPSSEYIAAGGSSAVLTKGPFTIAAGGSLLRNLRLPYNASSAVTEDLPDGWYGSLKVTSSGPAIDGFVQLTLLSNPQNGDTLQAHGVFPLP